MREIVIFTAVCTGMFLAVVLVGYRYYCAWEKSEQERRHRDVHLAEVMREGQEKNR